MTREFIVATVFLVVILALAIAPAVWRALYRSITVHEYTRGLRFDRGKFTSLVEPGRYHLRIGISEIRLVDLRERHTSVSGQEVLSRDGVALKMSLVARFRVVDPKRYVLEIEQPEVALHSALQIALRSIVTGSSAEELLERRPTIGDELLKQAGEPAKVFGIELIAAEIKDLTLPGELKKLFTQVVKAKQDGLAALERARGETAALRSLANASRLVATNPSLMQLRWMQVLGEKGGNTIVLGVPSGPIPIGTASAGPLAEGESSAE